MGYRLFYLLLFVGTIGGAMSASDAGGPPRNTSAPVPESTVYVYLNRAGGWCAVRNRTTFMAEVKSDKASPLEADQAQVWLKGMIVVRVTEFRMDADSEWSTTSTYKLDESGNVVSANVVARSGKPATGKTLNFNVANGIYSPDTPSFLSPETFRKPVSASSFPYSDLIEKLASNKTAKKLCT